MLISRLETNNNVNFFFPKTSPISFHGLAPLPADRFEKSKNNFEMKVFNPFTNKYCQSDVSIDLNKAQKIVLKNPDKNETDLILDYDPSRTGTLYNKQSGTPFSVNILESTTKNFDKSVGYHFMSKDLKHEYGYVHLFFSEQEENYKEDLSADFVKEDIIGDRVEVLYLRNFDDGKIGGVGKLADKMTVKYCIKNGIEPNIISYADTGSHVAHYKRGKRFIEPQKGSDEWNFLKDQYGKTNPNVILEELIKKADASHEDVDLTGWGYLIMYMPKELANKYR